MDPENSLADIAASKQVEKEAKAKKKQEEKEAKEKKKQEEKEAKEKAKMEKAQLVLSKSQGEDDGEAIKLKAEKQAEKEEKMRKKQAEKEAKEKKKQEEKEAKEKAKMEKAQSKLSKSQTEGLGGGEGGEDDGEAIKLKAEKQAEKEEKMRKKQEEKEAKEKAKMEKAQSKLLSKSRLGGPKGEDGGKDDAEREKKKQEEKEAKAAKKQEEKEAKEKAKMEKAQSKLMKSQISMPNGRKTGGIDIKASFAEFFSVGDEKDMFLEKKQNVATGFKARRFYRALKDVPYYSDESMKGQIVGTIPQNSVIVVLRVVSQFMEITSDGYLPPSYKAEVELSSLKAATLAKIDPSVYQLFLQHQIKDPKKIEERMFVCITDIDGKSTKMLQNDDGNDDDVIYNFCQVHDKEMDYMGNMCAESLEALKMVKKLHLAAKRGDLAFLTGKCSHETKGEENCQLIIYGLDGTVGQKSALMYAIGSRHYDIVDYLVSGAWGGIDSPFGFEDVLKLVRRRDAYGRTALMHACRYGSKTIVEKLFEARANSNEQDNEGKTAAMIAAEFGMHAALKTLIEIDSQIDLSLADQDGQTVFTVADSNKDVYPRVLDLLEEKKGSVIPDIPSIEKQNLESKILEYPVTHELEGGGGGDLSTLEQEEGRKSKSDERVSMIEEEKEGDEDDVKSKDKTDIEIEEYGGEIDSPITGDDDATKLKSVVEEI